MPSTCSPPLRAAAADMGPVEGKEAMRLAQALSVTASDRDVAVRAYRAEFLKLPSESDIARELAREVDTDAVHQARETLRATIGSESRRSLGRAL